MPKAVDGWKICSKCREEKLVSEFHKNRRTSDGLQYPCKACEQAYNKGRYEAKREELLIQSAEYSATEAGQATRKHYEQSNGGKVARKRYNQSDGGKVVRQRYEQSPGGQEVQRTASKRYEQTPGGQEVRQRANRKRRALKAGAISDLASEDYAILDARHPVCNYCGHSFSENGGPFKRVPDHVVPYSRGGQNVLSNLVYACARCNGNKGAKLPEEWVDRWYERVKGGHRHV